MTLVVRSQDYNSIVKIVLVLHPHFGQGNLSQDTTLVYQKLTSPLGTPPIYGANDPRGLRIIDNTGPRGRICQTINRPHLVQIAQALGLNPAPTLTRDGICGLIRQQLQEIGHII